MFPTIELPIMTAGETARKVRPIFLLEWFKRTLEDQRAVGADGPEPAVVYVVETPWAGDRVEDEGAGISGSRWAKLLVSRMGFPKSISAPFTKDLCLDWDAGSITVASAGSS